MDNYRAIPEGHMTVGELAKKVNVTVRTLQYYDKEGLLTPSAMSEGGRRLYTNKDMVRLHQVLSLKYLGFSLDDIRSRLVSLDSPDNVAGVLSEQADMVIKQINALNDTLTAIEALRAEVVQMRTVDFNKYAEIIRMLQMGNQNYWVVTHFDEKVISHIKERFTEKSGKALAEKLQTLCELAIQLQSEGKAPESEQGQSFAKSWWDMVMEFTGGDMSLIPELKKFADNRQNWNSYLKDKLDAAAPFMQKSLEVYLAKQNMNIGGQDNDTSN